MYTSYKLFHGHWGAISGFLHISQIRFINGVYPAITRIDSLRPAVTIFLLQPCSCPFSSLRAGPSPHAWFIRGKVFYSSFGSVSSVLINGEILLLLALNADR